MARKRKTGKVPRDNVRTLRIGDASYELEASLGAGIVYANEFLGKLDAPYVGRLDDDLMAVWRGAQETLRDEDGKSVPNPDYRGVDVMATLRVAWAMARAAGSTDATFDEFLESVIHQPAGVYEEASLYGTVVLALGGGFTFRKPEGLGGAEEPDEEKA